MSDWERALDIVDVYSQFAKTIIYMFGFLGAVTNLKSIQPPKIIIKYLFRMEMIPDPLLFTVTLIGTGALLFLLVYFTIILSDLECDYLNAQQCCSRLNFWVIPKLVAHAFLTIAIIVTGHYWLFLFNAPMLVWNGYELYSLPAGNMGVYDPTEIHNRGMIKKHMRNCMIHLGYFLIFFFVYLYCLINALLKGDPIRRHEDDEIITEL